MKKIEKVNRYKNYKKMEKKKEKRGGARKGSGPKRKIQGETKRATFYIEVELLEKLPANKSLFVNRAISRMLENKV